MHCKNFEDLILVNDKLLVTAAKIMSPKNLYAYHILPLIWYLLQLETHQFHHTIFYIFDI